MHDGNNRRLTQLLAIQVPPAIAAGLGSILILLYGAGVVTAVEIIDRVTSGLSGWGDGATVRHAAAPWSSAWPCAVFFLLSACAPFLRRRRAAGKLWLVSILVLFLCLRLGLEAVDAATLSLIVAAVSAPVWILVLLLKKGR